MYPSIGISISGLICTNGRIKISNLYVIAGPSGVGKSSLIHRLLDQYPQQVSHPLTYTTRSQRPGEENGRDMNFIPRTLFSPRLLGNEFIAHTEYAGEFYGTLKQDVLGAMHAGKKVVVAFDESGVDCIRSLGFPALFIWLAAPSKAALETWLQKRWPEKGPLYEARLLQAVKEMDRFETDKQFRSKFNYWMLSRDLSEMTAELATIMGLKK